MTDRHAGSDTRPARRALRRAALVVTLATGTAGAVLLAAELHDETVAAWELYVAATEQRIAAELDDGERFLVLDFQQEAARLRREALAGDVVVERLRTLDERREQIKVPKGTIQHWLGAVLVPNATLSDVLDGLQHDIPLHELQEDVLESRILSRDGDTVEMYMRVQLDAPMASAQLNMEQVVEYVRPGGDRAWSRAEATRIAELENPGSPNEREKPIGNDSGYLWRVKMYWRYVQVDGGVLVEVEQLTLSRSIPALARWVLAPALNGASRDAVSDMLQAIVTHLGSAEPADAG